MHKAHRSARKGDSKGKLVPKAEGLYMVLCDKAFDKHVSPFSQILLVSWVSHNLVISQNNKIKASNISNCLG